MDWMNITEVFIGTIAGSLLTTVVAYCIYKKESSSNEAAEKNRIKKDLINKIIYSINRIKIELITYDRISYFTKDSIAKERLPMYDVKEFMHSHNKIVEDMTDMQVYLTIFINKHDEDDKTGLFNDMQNVIKDINEYTLTANDMSIPYEENEKNISVDGITMQLNSIIDRLQDYM